MNVRALTCSQTQTNCSSTHGTACIVRCRLHLTRRAWPSPDASVSRVAPKLPSVPSFPATTPPLLTRLLAPCCHFFLRLFTPLRSTVARPFLCLMLLYHTMSLHSPFCPWAHSTNRDITFPSNCCATSCVWATSNRVRTAVRLQSRMRIKHATCHAMWAMWAISPFPPSRCLRGRR